MKTVIVLLLLVVAVSVCDAQWVPVGLPGRGIRDIAIGNNSMFAVTNDSGSVYRSTDGGFHWIQIIQSGVSKIAVSPTGNVFVFKSCYFSPTWSTDSLYRSTDGGSTWTATYGPYQWWLTSLAFSPNGTVFCGNLSFSAFFGGFEWFVRSTDDGLSWNRSPDLVSDLISFHEGSVVSAGLIPHGGGVGSSVEFSHSTNDGITWSGHFLPQVPQFLDPTALTWTSGGIFFSGRDYYTGSFGLFLSTNLCTTWTQVSTVFPRNLLDLPSGCMLAGTDSDGVFLFSDNGDSLGTRNQGLTNLQVHKLALDPAGYVYAGTGSGVWRRPLSEVVTSMGPSPGDLPNKFILEQNYPNPFNPSTTISYQLPTQNHVVLKVYDLLGREVATLVNEVKQPGTYTVQWNATGFASGVYFYRLQAGNFVETRKLTLMK